MENATACSGLRLSASLRQIEASHAGLPLMERAGRAAADFACELAGDRQRPVLILAGPGNNGGDAFVVARLLRQRFFDVRLVYAGDPARLPPDAAAARNADIAAGGGSSDRIPAVDHWGLIVDGLFGIGLTRAPDGIHAEWIDTANRLARRDGCPLLALDCPSGLDADRGRRPGTCIAASHTITFIAGKPGLFTGDGPDHCGQIRVADLDLPALPPADGEIVGRAHFAACLQARRRNSHKGVFGSVGILGGGPSMSGAALLAGRAALKFGAGRVYLGLLDPAAPSVDPVQPELMIRPPAALFEAELQALACGPGLGTDGAAAGCVERALASPLPLLLDADALNLLAVDARLQANLRQRAAPSLLTPHPAEAARLLGCSTPAVQDDRIAAACELARRCAAVVALKGCGTVVASADGRWWINTTGNPGMASAGMGDVLSGQAATLLAQQWPAESALLAAVHLHGAAGDRLVDAGIGPAGMTASELIDAARICLNRCLAGAAA